MNLTAINEDILCTEGDFGDQVLKNTGIIVKSNAKESQGITPRWFKVLSVGPQADQNLKPGQWLLVEYGRWSTGLVIDRETTIWKVDPEKLLAISDEKPETFYYNREVATADKLVY